MVIVNAAWHAAPQRHRANSLLLLLLRVTWVSATGGAAVWLMAEISLSV